MQDFETLINQLLQIAIDNNYTPKEVRDATKAQVAGLLGVSASNPKWTGGNIGFFNNLKETIARQLEINIKQVKFAKVKPAIATEFEDVEYDVNYRKGKVVAYLNGKPKSGDDE